MFANMKGPKTLLAEGITAALDEYFEVDPDAIEAELLGETQIVLSNTRLRPRTTLLLENKLEQTRISCLTTGIVKQVLFAWTWAPSLGNEYLVKDSRLVIRGLCFKTQLSCDISCSSSSDENRKGDGDNKNQETLPENGNKSTRRRSSLADIKREGLLEAYIRNQVDHIIDALTLAVEDFEFTIQLPPNECGEVSGITAKGHPVELKSVGGALGDEGRLRHRASFVNGGLRQQLSFGSICLGIFKSTYLSGNNEELTTKEFPLLEPLSYQLSATRYFGERFSGVTSGIKAVGVPVFSSRDNIEEMDIVVHAGLDQIHVLVELGNLMLQKMPPSERDEARIKPVMSRDDGTLRQDTRMLGTLFEETKQHSSSEDEIDDTLWYPTLTTEEWREIEQDYSDDDTVEEEEKKEDVYSALVHDLKKSSVFQFPITGVSVILPNEAKLTLEALCVNYRADGTVMNLEGDYGAGILIDGFQLVNTNDGSDGAAKSRWVVNWITSRFTIEEETGSGTQPESNVARIRWTETKLDRLIMGLAKLLEAIKDLNLEKRPEYEFSGAISNGFSISFGV